MPLSAIVREKEFTEQELVFIEFRKVFADNGVIVSNGLAQQHVFSVDHVGHYVVINKHLLYGFIVFVSFEFYGQEPFVI